MVVGTPGQNATLTFTGTVGQRLSITIGATAQGNVVTDPDQTVLLYGGVYQNGTFVVEPFVLPTSGAFTIFLDPLSFATGTINVAVNEVPADITGTITPGTPTAVTIAAHGQNARLTFSGTAGQRVSLQTTAGPVGFVSILRPDQTTVAIASTGAAASFIDVQTLTTTGTYTAFLNPTNAATGSITITLHDVPPDAGGPTTIGAAPLPVSITVPGQNGAVTFTGAASQQVTVQITGNQLGLVNVRLLRPDGTQLQTKTSSAAAFNLTPLTLPTAGTYTVTINPNSPNTGSINVQITNP